MGVSNDIIYNSFIDTIKKKLPGKSQLVNTLSDLLFIEKEAVYRRLRGDVPFTFSEVVKIAKNLNISLDEIIGFSMPQSHPFQLKLPEYYKPKEIDLAMHREFIDLLSIARNDPETEMGYVTSILPLHFSVKFENIHRIYTLRWLYQFGSPGAVPSFSEIIFSEELRELFKRYLYEVQYFKSTFFIFDELMLIYLTNDIKYFNAIRLISDEEVKMLKKELYNFLDDLEMISFSGAYENGNKIYIYLSSLNFETTYSYIQASQYKLTMIKTFTLNETTSLDEKVFDKVKTWIQGIKRTSTLISGSDEKNRIMFFERQRKILEENL